MEQVKERNQYLLAGARRAVDFIFLYNILCAMGMIASAFVFGFNPIVVTISGVSLFGNLFAYMAGKRIGDNTASEIAQSPPREWPDMPVRMLKMVNDRYPHTLYQEDVPDLMFLEGDIAEVLRGCRFVSSLPRRTPEPPEPKPEPVAEFMPDAAWLCSI